MMFVAGNIGRVVALMVVIAFMFIGEQCAENYFDRSLVRSPHKSELPETFHDR